MTFVLFGLAGCTEELQLRQQQSAILGGSESQHPAVGLLLHDSPNPDEDRLCSATLVAPRFVLTAAHCVTARTSPPHEALDPLYFYAGAGAHLDTESGIPGGHLYLVHDVTVRSGYSGGGAADLAVVELSSDVPSWVAEPMPLASHAPSVNEIVTLVGFGMGTLGDASTAGVQREAETRVTRRHSTTFRTEGRACHGDSGGPALWGGAVVGVHSGVMDASCATALDMRVDVYRSWITAVIHGGAGEEPPSEPVGGQYGESCEVSGDCESHVCVTISSWFSSYSACSMWCDPDDPHACPEDDSCDEEAGICVPSRGGKSDQLRVDRVQADEASGGCSFAGPGVGGPGAVLLLLVLSLIIRSRRR